MGEEVKTTKSSSKKKKKDKGIVVSFFVKIIVFSVTISLLVAIVFLTRTLRDNASMVFYGKAVKYVSTFYSMRANEYIEEREKYLQEHDISLIIVYSPARRILASNSEDIPYSELGPIITNKIISLQKGYDKNVKHEYIVKSIVDFSKELNGNFYYIRLFDDSFAQELYNIKMRNDFLITFIVFIAFYFLYIFNKFEDMRNSMKERNDLVTLGSASRRLAHEIKNPVAAIMMQVSLLERMHPDQAQEFEVIKTEGKRIVNLTDRIREFMADPVGNIEFINFLDFMREEIGYFKPDIITANFYILDEASFIYFDKTRLRSIIINVIQNAIDSQVEKSECRVVINVSSIHSGSKIKVEIMDYGTGIKESDKTKVFNPFFTTKNVGTGIGLSISKQFLNARNGSIDLSNRYDANGKVEGATCTIILDKSKVLD